MLDRVSRVWLHAVVLLAFSSAAGVHADDLPPASRTAGLIGAFWGYPTKATVGFGVITTHLPANYECKTPCLFHGVTFQVAAGLGGGELALGYGSLMGETGRGAWLLRRVFIGYGVRAAMVRTWGLSTLDPSGATFMGVEGAMTVAQFGLRLGVFHRVESVSGQGDWRVFGGAGWGF